GAGASPTDTLVPASNDATLRAAAAPRVRRTAGRLPTRVPADVRWADRRPRSTNPPTDTRAYDPRVSRTRTCRPGWTLPIARPFGVVSTADGVFTRVCAASGSARIDSEAKRRAATAALRSIERIGVDGRIAGWSMCARIHSTENAHAHRCAEPSGKRNSEQASRWR